MLRPPRQAFVGDMPTPARGTSPGRLASTPNAVVAGEFRFGASRQELPAGTLSSPLEVAARIASSWRAPIPEHRPCRSASPPKNWDLLLALAAPIDHRQRDQFLREVAAELGPGLGVLHRVGRVIQRKYFT